LCVWLVFFLCGGGWLGVSQCEWLFLCIYRSISILAE